MIRPNRSYSFVSAANLQPKASDFSNARTLESVDDILEANARIGKYIPEMDAELDKKCHECAERVEIRIKTTDAGNDVNDAVIVRKDGKEIGIRLYGTDKKLVNPQTITKAQLKELHFHKCKSDGEVVGMPSVDKTGKPCIVPTIYLAMK